MVLTKYLIDLVKKNLKESEKQASAKLIETYQAFKTEELKSFEEMGMKVYTEATNFLELYYKTTQIIDCSTNVAEVLKKIYECQKRLDKLHKTLENHKHLKALVYVKKYESKLDELAEWIEEDKFSAKDFFKAHKDEILQTTKDSVNGSVILTIFRPIISEQMPKTSNLFNYQSQKILDVTEMIYQELEKLVKKHNLSQVYLQDVSQDEIDEFCRQIASEKIYAEEMHKSPSIPQEQKENILMQIAGELVSNIIYRIVWEDRVKLSAR